MISPSEPYPIYEHIEKSLYFYARNEYDIGNQVEVTSMKKWMRTTLIVIFAAVFLGCGGYLAYYYINAWQEQSDYDKLAAMKEQAQTEMGGITRPTVPNETTPGGEPVVSGPILVPVEKDNGEVVEVLYDYAEIYKLNNEMVGWMTIPGTNVNYPVMQSKTYNKDFYLYRSFFKKWTNAGSLYVRESCDVFAPSDNLTIYGHNMRNSGTMFHQLLQYEDKSFWETHQYIQFDTINEYHTYQIIAVFKTSANIGQGFAYHIFENASDEADFDNFINNCKANQFYDTGLTAEYGDKLITLSTCEYTLDNGRFVVVAKRIS